jgi:hypothetical protein
VNSKIFFVDRGKNREEGLKIKLFTNAKIDNSVISSKNNDNDPIFFFFPGLGPLKYPGKVSTQHNILAISDTGYHRIIIADLQVMYSEWKPVTSRYLRICLNNKV